jgi:hypothetical protein
MTDKVRRAVNAIQSRVQRTVVTFRLPVRQYSGTSIMLVARCNSWSADVDSGIVE